MQYTQAGHCWDPAAAAAAASVVDGAVAVATSLSAVATSKGLLAATAAGCWSVHRGDKSMGELGGSVDDADDDGRLDLTELQSEATRSLTAAAVAAAAVVR